MSEREGDTISILASPTSAVPIEGEFSGWGSVSYADLEGFNVNVNVNVNVKGKASTTASDSAASKALLGEAAATAIAANDVVGSVLYSVGVSVAVAGKAAPLSLLLVALSLFVPFRGIIADVGRRVPLNGGAYSALLLAASKGLAACAAVCSILDYVATAVVSAASASAYFYAEFQIGSVYWATLGVLAVFGLLTMLGVRESSFVSLAILIIHLLTMLLVVIASIVQLAKSGTGVAIANFNSAPVSQNGFVYDLFLGYCVGMLGVTGFETSSNYIEEQAEGVFPKTLRNMCWLVLTLNPVVSLLALCIVPIGTIVANSNTVISVMADTSFGRWLRILVAVDAVIVLCGGVLTAFVGVAGLMEHMTKDNFLPPMLLFRPKNPFKKPHNRLPTSDEDPTRDNNSTESTLLPPLPLTRTITKDSIVSLKPHPNEKDLFHNSSTLPPLIPTTFFLLCTLLFVTFNGDITTLSQVFSLAFLSVLLSFTVSSLILRVRSDRESNHQADESDDSVIGGWEIILACLLVSASVAGNAVNNPGMVGTFLAFFGGVLVIVWGFLMRVEIMRVLVLLVFGPHGQTDREEEMVVLNSGGVVVGEVFEEEGRERRRKRGRGVKQILFDWVRESREKPVAYFTNGESLHHLNHVITYVHHNEPTKRLIVVHCYQEPELIPKSLEANCRILDHVYPDLRLDLVLVKTEHPFSDAIVSVIAKRLGVEKNMCLVSRPWRNSKHLGAIKGVRVILLQR